MWRCEREKKNSVNLHVADMCVCVCAIRIWAIFIFLFAFVALFPALSLSLHLIYYTSFISEVHFIDATANDNNNFYPKIKSNTIDGGGTERILPTHRIVYYEGGDDDDDAEKVSRWS